MDAPRFDALTRHLGATPRRRVVTALIAGTLGARAAPWAADEAGARCKKGRKRCPGAGCRRLKSDPEHCGACDHQCPPAKPCCIGGKCQPRCIDGAGKEVCCADCFVEILLTGTPDLDHPVCCASQGGTICGPNKKKKSDDRCCYPNQECVKGTCCCDGCEGAVKCGGKCCAIAACCNGTCCKKGKVCANTPQGKACVSASRGCGPGKPPCYSGEQCIGGICCSGARICGEVCCGAGKYCEVVGPNRSCCPINTICKGTYRGRRVRR